MELKIALAGNPNSGKTTLFNALTGSNQFVGNWSGVTVEKKEGKLKKHADVTITDLPGIYSLSPYTLEEVVSRNYLIEERPDAILNIIDGTNLERNLYLTTQLDDQPVRQCPYRERQRTGSDRSAGFPGLYAVFAVQALQGSDQTVQGLTRKGVICYAAMDLRKSWNHSNLYRVNRSNRSDFPQSDSSAQAGQSLLRM